jgi:hypothetical protein
MNCFVFGSNLAGRHGKGAALEARINYGAHYGVGRGIQGLNPAGKLGCCYAIPTKSASLKTLPLSDIKSEIDIFLRFAEGQTNITFNVTRIGCGLAGYKDCDIAPMFAKHSTNVTLPKEWKSYESSPL